MALVVGAGCSVEPPTSLKLSSEYSREAHNALVADGVLAEGKCSEPEDLSELAEFVFQQSESQADLVKRLPRHEFRTARPNDGYLNAVALMLEGVVSCVVTLNYDLALAHAVSELGGGGISVINGSKDVGDLGSKSVIYLHGNANATDEEGWILRKTVLEEEWRNTWQTLVADRVSTSPFLIFAGLGSPAAVLAESVSRLRQINAGVPTTYVVDPYPDSQFSRGLEIPEDNHMQMKWSEFMKLVSKRVARECCRDIKDSATSISEEQGWDTEAGRFEDLIACFHSAGLRVMGRTRAVWLCREIPYQQDSPENRDPMAQLLLALGKILADPIYELSINRDGLIRVRVNGRIKGYAMALHGAGVKLRSTVRELVQKTAANMTEKPDVVLVAGFVATSSDDLAPPGDIIPR